MVRFYSSSSLVALKFSYSDFSLFFPFCMFKLRLISHAIVFCFLSEVLLSDLFFFSII